MQKWNDRLTGVGIGLCLGLLICLTFFGPDRIRKAATPPSSTPNIALELTDIRATLHTALEQQSQIISNIMQKQVEQSSQWHATMRDMARTTTTPNVSEEKLHAILEEVHQLRENALK